MALAYSPASEHACMEFFLHTVCRKDCGLWSTAFRYRLADDKLHATDCLGSWYCSCDVHLPLMSINHLYMYIPACLSAC